MGISPNSLDNNGQTPLYTALAEGATDITTALLQDPRTDLSLRNIGISAKYKGILPPTKGTVLHFAMALSPLHRPNAIQFLYLISDWNRIFRTRQVELHWPICLNEDGYYMKTYLMLLDAFLVIP